MKRNGILSWIRRRNLSGGVNKKLLFVIVGVLILIIISFLNLKRDKSVETKSETKIKNGTIIQNSGNNKEVAFADSQGETHEMTINSEAEMQNYNPDGWVHEGDKLSYKDSSSYSYRLGVDVSEHQGDINWKKVKAAGYDFAIIRIAYRGYGKEGKLCKDAKYKENIENALAVGLDVGVYVFSQAINEKETLEEAELVIESLKDYQITGPVAFDSESILDDESRTDGVSGEQFTKNTVAFCEAVKKAGYTPMIYANMMWEAYQLDLTKLSGYEFWYADYEEQPQTPYQFTYWQYSEKANVDGIETNTDVNIQMIPVK